MSYTLRPYQQEAVNVAINWVRKHSEPCLLGLSPVLGKASFVQNWLEYWLLEDEFPLYQAGFHEALNKALTKIDEVLK